MELHALWARMDQLEQLILTQAREIDSLRIILNATQLANNSCRHRENGDLSKRWPVPMVQNDPILYLQAARNRLEPNNTRRPAEDRFQPAPANYAMSSIHPASAIPPVARHVVFTSNTHYNQPPTSQTRFERFSSEGPVSKGPKSAAAIIYRHQNQSRSLPAQARWSTGPSLVSTLTNSSNEKHNDGERNNMPERRRLHLIELFTCFCPCFSMC